MPDVDHVELLSAITANSHLSRPFRADLIIFKFYDPESEIAASIEVVHRRLTTSYVARIGMVVPSTLLNGFSQFQVLEYKSFATAEAAQRWLEDLVSRPSTYWLLKMVDQ